MAVYSEKDLALLRGRSLDDNVVRFTYHAPHGDQRERYERLRAEAHMLADVIVRLTPPSREQSLALTNLEAAVFWANAAIARREPEEDGS